MTAPGAVTLLTFVPPARMLNLNDGGHWAPRAARVKAWREATYWHAKAARILEQPPSHVQVTLPVVSNRRRDPNNWSPTVKAIVDGLVDAGVFVDDNSQWVTDQLPILDPGTKVVTVTITPR